MMLGQSEISIIRKFLALARGESGART